MKRTKPGKPKTCAPTEAYMAIKNVNCRPENVTRQREEGVGIRA